MVPTHYGRPVVVGHPNFFGMFEDLPLTHLVYVTGRWSNLRPLRPDATVVARDVSVPRNAAADSLERMRNLAKRLRQIPGVHLAFKPQSPILVLLVPRLEAVKDMPGIEVVSGAYPELPGGIRIELDDDASGIDLNRYAGVFEETISREA